MHSSQRRVASCCLLVIGSSGVSCFGEGRNKPKVEPTPDVGHATIHARRTFDLLAFAEVLGTVAPCGCTTEPLGGLQFAFGYVESQSGGDSTLLLEPGSFLFPRPDGPLWPADDAAWGQAQERAMMLQRRFSSTPRLVSGLGPTDIAAPAGMDALATYPMPRVAANVTVPERLGSIPTVRMVALSSGGLTWKVGVTGVVDPGLPGAAALGATEPAPGLTKALAQLDEDGAQLKVVLAQGHRGFVEGLVDQVPGIDVVIVGSPEGIEAERVGAPPRKLGDVFILEPGAQLQTMTQLRLSVAPSVEVIPPVSGWTFVPSPAELEGELKRLEARLAKFETNPTAEKSFLENLRARKAELKAQMGGQVDGDVVATLEQVKVTCKLPADAEARVALKRYDDVLAAENRARFKGVRPPEPASGQSGYAGIKTCGGCHDEAVSFWRTTAHAGAYATLVEGNKQYDLTCVGCHVTGFRQPGGSEVVENEGLIDVQCESCHGPGRLHAGDGGDDLSLIRLDAPAELCATACHTLEHSDTFQYDAYLRDILGPGHGLARREALGDGPTGRELRKAGLEAAGGSCKEKLL